MITTNSSSRSASHALMVTQSGNGKCDIHLSAHTRDRQNLHWRKIFNRQFWYWGYHIKRGNRY